MTPVRLEPAALRSRVKHSATEPLRSQCVFTCVYLLKLLLNKPILTLLVTNEYIIREGFVKEEKAGCINCFVVTAFCVSSSQCVGLVCGL